ncbi:MAG: hypothetical protein HOK52_00250 [Candidatus Marinimicrobia bacterium]|nr:hypothetical protein [Candidatus Neomarinimicrobiota bacterium]
MMEPVFVKILFDLHCDWEGIAPEYRIYVEDELFCERTFKWKEPVYLTEILQVEAEHGTYEFRLEKVEPQLSNFKIENTRVKYGPGNILSDTKFEILNEN